MTHCRWNNVYRRTFNRSVAGYSTVKQELVTPVQSHDVDTTPYRKPVMRIGDRGVEIVGDLSNEPVERELQSDVLNSPPQIDKNSFKDYIEIPKKGLISTKNIRICSNGIIPFKQYVEGSPNAHNYPLTLLPRKHSEKLGGDILVTTYAVHEKDYRMEGGRRIMLSALPTLKIHPCEVLLQKIYGKTSLLVIFSGDPPYADAKAALEWKKAVDFEVPIHMLLNYPCPVGMTYFHKRYVKALATSLVEHCAFSCIARNMSEQETVILHQYRRQFSSIVLLDRFGYIRWHAAGKPTREAKYLLKEAYENLQREI
ncbi:uncharacterized protein BXIN_2006 [Babesia sp. Xinjiang]|uniref:uncharacterized protein n=1 Tax=Babesia sp. Xinjiang TaxID=462227 RepID=UPI000A23E4FC|nr:uncharacterized protein BXIN_2006 [Babesia sp. Xinjiang]ORM40269.1 hypothetical protein BXIN_2006 [Babesia sp. Xinjiang]